MSGQLAGRAQFVELRCQLGTGARGRSGSWTWMTGWLQDKHRVRFEHAAGPSTEKMGAAFLFLLAKNWTKRFTSLMQMMRVPLSSCNHSTPARRHILQANTTSPYCNACEQCPTCLMLIAYNSALLDPEPQCLHENLTLWMLMKPVPKVHLPGLGNRSSLQC